MGTLLRGMGAKVTQVGAEGITLMAARVEYRYRSVTEPGHTCRQPGPLQVGDIVIVLKVAENDRLFVHGPCGCVFVLHDRES